MLLATKLGERDETHLDDPNNDIPEIEHVNIQIEAKDNQPEKKEYWGKIDHSGHDLPTKKKQSQSSIEENIRVSTNSYSNDVKSSMDNPILQSADTIGATNTGHIKEQSTLEKSPSPRKVSKDY